MRPGWRRSSPQSASVSYCRTSASTGRLQCHFRRRSLIPTKYRPYNILTEWFGLDTKIRVRPLDLAVSCGDDPAVDRTVMVRLSDPNRQSDARHRAGPGGRGADGHRRQPRDRRPPSSSVASLAGAAGMIALYYNNSARFQMGFRYGLFAFTAAVLGGIGNLNGAVSGRIHYRHSSGRSATAT